MNLLERSRWDFTLFFFVVRLFIASNFHDNTNSNNASDKDLESKCAGETNQENRKKWSYFRD